MLLLVLPQICINIQDWELSNLFRISSKEMVSQFRQRSFTKNWQNWFSLTKSRQWTSTVCPNATKYLTCFWAHIMQPRGQSWYQQKSSWNRKSYRDVAQLGETYCEARSATDRFQTQEGAAAVWRGSSNAAKRHCDDDVCWMLTMSGSLSRRYSRSSHQSTPKMIVCMLQQLRNRPLQVVVWSRAASTSAKAWCCPSLYAVS